MKYLPHKTLNYKEKKSNTIVENLGRHCLIQVIKLNIFNNRTNENCAQRQEYAVRNHHCDIPAVDDNWKKIMKKYLQNIELKDISQNN